MKKIIKGVVWTVCAVLSLLILSALIHPLWVGPTGAAVARSIVPDMTKSEFGMDALGINLYSGTVFTEGVNVKNPGDAKIDAVSLKAFRVTFSSASMLTDERHINEIVIDGLKVYGDKTFSNLREIVANINEYVGEEKDEDEKSGSKLLIDRVFITGTEFKWGIVKVSLPDIELKDIGKNGAVSDEEAFTAIVDAICAAADKVALGLGKTLKIAIEGGGMIADGIKAVTDAVGGNAAEVGSKAADGTKKAAAGLRKTVEGIKGIKEILK